MEIKKKYYKKIVEGYKNIFNTHIEEGSEDYLKGNLSGFTTTVREPLVRHQIIQLAKLCEEVPMSVTLRSSGNSLYIEFW
tara:strand:+ start:82970 stop:83209 length:240 start_codon:yes stop_codon:yes gene_type:complete